MEQLTFNLTLARWLIGSDHAGFEYKEEVISYLEGKGVQIKGFRQPIRLTPWTTRTLRIRWQSCKWKPALMLLVS